jgi:hypothetical protein
MARPWVPVKLVSLLTPLHKKVKVKFVIEGAEQIIDSIIGVKQGDVLGPDLFIFFMAPVLKPWRSFSSYKLCTVRCKVDFQLTRRKPATKGDMKINISDWEYANDTAFNFEYRDECIKVIPLIIKHLARWGLEVHIGTKEKDSK